MHGHPKTRFTPTEIAPDTFLIHDHQGEGEAPVSVGLNTMVIRAAEPVVVDTGMAENQDQYLADVFDLVEPEDVRWVFISHDDVDHTGNLNVLMERCPNATAVIDWFMAERMGGSLRVPPTRWRWMADGESLDVGDRRLSLVRPPVFDAPTSRGLFDPTTGVYWGVDSFAAPMPVPVTDADEIDVDEWTQGMVTFNHYVSPWLTLVDERRFQKTVDRIEALHPDVIVGCHTPVIRGARVAQALRTTRRTLALEPTPQPDQTVLDQIQLTLTAPAA